jgi:hypothetical protein
MDSLFDKIFTIIFGSFTNVTQGVVKNFATLEDFFYVKVWGLSFIVLGSRQTGKTTLIEWLRRNMASIDDFAPDPTTAGGDAVPNFASRVDENKYVRLKANRDVGGEYAMWDTDWVELFREAQPRGILFLIDHTDPHLHKDALNFVMQMIEDEPESAKNLRAFFILVNKSDLWGGDMTVEDITQNYRNEFKRLKNQADRMGYKWSVSEGSLVTGNGVALLIRKFFNTLRPKPRPQSAV